MRLTFAAVALTASLFNFMLSPATLLDPVWSFLTDLWGAPEQTDAGCRMDPSGVCSSQPQSDGGCRMDPNGQCIPSAQ